METGLVKTTSLTAAPAALPRPRGTVRAVGLFSSVTSRQAEVPVRSGNGNDAAGVSRGAGGGTPAGIGSLLSGNIPAGAGMRMGGNGASLGHTPDTNSRRGSNIPGPAAFPDVDRGGRHAEYLLVIYPGGELEEKLLGEQKQFSDDYAVAVRNKPHITVAAFQAGEMMEETLIRWIQRICAHYQSFDLTLNNYSGFPPHTIKPAEPPRSAPSTGTPVIQRTQTSGQIQPGEAKVANEPLPMARPMSWGVPERANFSSERVPGTIYLRVQDPQPFWHLLQQLQAIDEFIRSSGCPPVNLISRPFLSIAGGLTEQVYNKAMPDYSRRTFHDSFHVRELVLLKRSHAFDPCKTVNIFRLRTE